MKRHRAAIRFLATLCLCALSASATAGPFAPAAGQPGSTAIAMNDPGIVGWATGYEHYIMGPENIYPQFQNPNNAVGPAAGTVYDVLTLGRGGSVVMTFDTPIANGPGWDFAVFGNAFDYWFLELAYVEVSSDGVTFARFPSVSLTPSPVPSFGFVDPTNVDGLAGKYVAGYGTPFDLSDLPAEAIEHVNIDRITHVRIVDIIGDGARFDSLGNPIYDPYPTFETAGFDLDAIAALNWLVLGDFNGDGALSGLDIPGFKQALANPEGWASANPNLPHPNTLGDFNADGVFSGLDIPGFKQALAGSAAVVVPEPATALLVGGVVLGVAARRRRRPFGIAERLLGLIMRFVRLVQPNNSAMCMNTICHPERSEGSFEAIAL